MDGGFGPWGPGRNLQAGPFMQQGGNWQGYGFFQSMMAVGGLGPGPWFNQGFGMPPGLPPVPDRPPLQPEFSEVRNPGFDASAGWQGEQGKPFWDWPGASYVDFSQPIDQCNTRGMDNHPWKKKRKRVFSVVQPAPVKSDKKSDDATKTHQQSKPLSQPAASQVKDTKQQNGKAKKQKKRKNKGGKRTPGWRGPTQEQSVDYTPSTTFSCKVCKFETPDEAEIQRHFVSNQHMEVMKQLYIFLPKHRVDFIQEYLQHEKIMVSRERLKQNLLHRRDSFKGIGQEHFFHRVEVAHCTACDTLIPDVPELLIEHTTSDSHVQNCKASLKEIKNNCLAMAKEILQDKYALNLLKVYNRGENPFKDTEWAPMHTASSYEVLVAEEDDYVSPVEDVDGTQYKEDSNPGHEDSSSNALPARNLEVKERKDSNSETVLLSSDIDGTDDEEEAEAAEAP